MRKDKGVIWHVITWTIHWLLFLIIWFGMLKFTPWPENVRNEILLGVLFIMCVRELFNLKKHAFFPHNFAIPVTNWNMIDGIMDLVGPFLVLAWSLS